MFVSWSGSDGATFYTVWRWENGAYVFIGNPSPPAATSFLDQNSLPNRAYFYAVKAHNGSGASDFSGRDIVSTIVFTDPTLTAGMPIRMVHLTELRNAADVLTALAGSAALMYTDPTIMTGVTQVKALHFREVESALLAARGALGLSVPSTLGITAGAVIPVAHVNTLRSYAQ